MQSQIQAEEAGDQVDQLKRKFQKEQFTDIVLNLLRQFKIPISHQALQQTYNGILYTNGAVTGKDILQSIQQLKQKKQIKNQLESQIKNYQKIIGDLRHKYIKCISAVQFEKTFGESDPKGVITEEILKKLKHIDYISIQKLEKVLCDIQKQYLNSGKISSSIIEGKVNLYNLEKSNIFEEQSNYNNNSKQDVDINSVRQYIQNSTMDIAIRNNLLNMMKLIKDKIEGMENNESIMKEVQLTLRNNLQTIDQQLYNSYKELDKRDSQVDRLRAKVKLYEQQTIQLNKRYQNDVINNLVILQEDNQKLNKNIVHLTSLNEQLQTKVEWFQTNYQQISKQYQRHLKQKLEHDQKLSKQKQQRMFIQRTTKEHLEDALAKIARLRTQNSELKQKNSDVVCEYQNKISSLEQRIKQVQQSRKAYKISKSFIANSKIRNSYLHPGHSRIEDSQNITIKRSNIQRSNMTVQQQNNRRSSVQQFKSYIMAGQNSDAFKKKKQIISIRLSELQIDDDPSYFEDNQKLVNKQQSQQSGQKQKKSLASKLNKTMKEQSGKKVQAVDDSKPKVRKQKRLIASACHTIISDGSRHPGFLIVSQDRFSFLDTKIRPSSIIKFSQLKKIIFCHHNTSWIVLKLKPNQLNEKKQQINDIVISVLINREDILEFIRLRCSKKILQNAVKIEFQKQENIWISTFQAQTLLSNFNNYYNLCRISINNAGNMFQVNIKQSSFFNTGDDAIIVVTSIGILVFERDGDYLLQRQQRLLYIVPIVELMEVQTETQAENKLIIKYKVEKKIIFRIKLQSKSMARKLKQLIQWERLKTKQNKQMQIQKYSIFTSALAKSNGVNS